MKKILMLFSICLIISCSKEIQYLNLENSKNPINTADSVIEKLNNAVNNNANNQNNILIIIDENILLGVENNLIRFVEDINFDSQNVYLTIEKDNSFFEIKDIIKQHKTEYNIDGCIFVGDIPIPFANWTNHINNTLRGISTQFYMDLDGEFEFQNDEIVNHTGETTIELWLSVIPLYGTNPIENMNGYFNKNHKYRSGEMLMEKGFINTLIGAQIDNLNTYNIQLDHLLNNIYLDLNERGNLFFGIDNQLNDYNMYPNAHFSYTTEMLTNKYDVAKIGAHGNSLKFGSFDEFGSIIIDIEYAKNTNIKSMLILETSCNSAAIDRDTNLACEFLFNPNNNVVAYSGATADQSGKGWTEFGDHKNLTTQKLTEGSHIGEAIFAPMYHKYDAEYSDGLFNDFREHFSAQQIMLGDGSLRLQEFMY